MHAQLPILPVLVPLATAILCLALTRRTGAASIAAVISVAAQCAVAAWLALDVAGSGIVVYRVGGWPAPYGIVLTADLLAATLLCLAAVLETAALVYGLGYLRGQRQRQLFLPLFFFQMTGVNGAFLTGDIFNLFVCFEIMLVSTFALLSFLGERDQIEATLKTMAMSLVASAFMIVAIALVYAAVGTLNMADIAVKTSALSASPVLVVAFGLFLVVFGLKAAVIPLHFWLPDAHSTAPTPVSAILSGLVVKVGIYGVIRLCFLFLAPLRAGYQELLVALAIVTMAWGALGAVGQDNIKRLLAYSTISQVGYVLLAVSLFTVGGISAAVLYIVCHAIMKAALFLFAGILAESRGTLSLRGQGGLLDDHPVVAVGGLFAALALGGIPPFSGFFPKLAVLQQSIAAGRPVAATAVVVIGFVTLFYIGRAWQDASWGRRPDGIFPRPVGRAMTVPAVALGALCLLLGLAAGPLVDWTDRVAAEVVDPHRYIRAVAPGGADFTGAAGDTVPMAAAARVDRDGDPRP